MTVLLFGSLIAAMLLFARFQALDPSNAVTCAMPINQRLG